MRRRVTRGGMGLATSTTPRTSKSCGSPATSAARRRRWRCTSPMGGSFGRLVSGIFQQVGVPVIADIDASGRPSVILGIGTYVCAIDYRGNFKWCYDTGTTGGAPNLPPGVPVSVYDLEGTGIPEVIVPIVRGQVAIPQRCDRCPEEHLRCRAANRRDRTPATYLLLRRTRSGRRGREWARRDRHGLGLLCAIRQRAHRRDQWAGQRVAAGTHDLGPGDVLRRQH